MERQQLQGFEEHRIRFDILMSEVHTVSLESSTSLLSKIDEPAAADSKGQEHVSASYMFDGAMAAKLLRIDAFQSQRNTTLSSGLFGLLSRNSHNRKCEVLSVDIVWTQVWHDETNGKWGLPRTTLITS